MNISNIINKLGLIQTIVLKQVLTITSQLYNHFIFEATIYHDINIVSQKISQNLRNHFCIWLVLD